ncbi:MAG: export transporter permease LptF [Pseudomonadota bacterium]|jgi:lipopolysaccharide export system permease protein
MLFHSSIRRELARSFGATFVGLATIVMTMILIRTLGQATRGNVNPTEVMLVMGYTVLGHLPTILTLSLFISIVSTLSRLYRDSEMAVWFSSGQGLISFVGPIVRFVWPILLVVTLLALFAWPWTQQKSQYLKDRYEQRGDLDRVTPGQFQESADGSRVFFIDKDSPNGKTGGEILIMSNEKGKQLVTSARSGRIETIDGDRFLILSRGQRLESAPGKPDLTLSEFEGYGVRIGEKALAAAADVPARALTTQVLLREPTARNLGELSWRIGLAVAAVNLALIGLVVSSVNPRVGRSGNLIFALFAFILYYNLLSLGQSWIASGKTDFMRFMLSLHGGVFVIAMAWLCKRHFNWTPGLLFRHKTGVVTATLKS